MPAMRIDLAGGPSRVVVPMIVEPVDRAACFRHPDQLWNRICQGVELAFTGLEGSLRALAFRDLLGGDVDADDFAIRIAVRMPIGDPKTLFNLIGTLAGDFDSGHGIAGPHDRLHDGFDRVRQGRHAIADIAAEMAFHGDAADIGQ